jgi:hypothetical protein
VLYTGKTLHLDAAGFGILIAAMAVGAVLGGWKIAPLLTKVDPMLIMGGALVLEGLVWGAFSLVTNAYLAFLVAPLLGLATVLVTVAGVGVVQMSVPNDLLGRVTSIFRLVVIGAAGLGAIAGGAIASEWGLRVPQVISTVFLIGSGIGFAVIRGRWGDATGIGAELEDDPDQI